MTTDQSNKLDAIYNKMNKEYSVIQLTTDYECKVTNYVGTVSASFTIPSNKMYIGCGISSMSHSKSGGGSTGSINAIYNNENTINVSIQIKGNWGTTTVTGTIVLNVFVRDK